MIKKIKMENLFVLENVFRHKLWYHMAVSILYLKKKNRKEGREKRRKEERQTGRKKTEW